MARVTIAVFDDEHGNVVVCSDPPGDALIALGKAAAQIGEVNLVSDAQALAMGFLADAMDTALCKAGRLRFGTLIVTERKDTK